MKIQFVAALGVTSLLVACGGSSTGGSIPNFSSALAVTDEGRAALERVQPLDLTAPENFQRSGSATFDGTIVINDQDGDASVNAGVVGGMTVTVDFANAANVTGTAGNFFDIANTRPGGTLTLSNVEFSEGTGGGGFVADVTGQLTDVGPPGVDDNYNYDLDMATIYYGDGIQALVALMGGTATEVGTTTTRDLSGAATLER